MNFQLPSALALRAAGWAFEGDVPAVKKCVCLAVPHTSTLDGFLMMAVTQSIGLNMEWMVKESWTRGPLGKITTAFGGLAVDRTQTNNVVQAMIDEFARRDKFVLVISPEGKRLYTEHWKSGFYHIAVGAQVPVVPTYLDYARKRAGIGAPITMTGDVRVDMDAIRAYYADKTPGPRRPALFGPIRLKLEDEVVAKAAAR